jgi:hypothetical protein
MKRLPTFLLVWAATTAPAAAATFHVAPAGSDATGDGSAAKPWASLDHAARRIPDDGSTVLVREGTYGPQTIARHFDRPATFRSHPPYRARLRSTPKRHRVLSLYRASNVILDGFEIEGAPDARGGEYLVHISTADAHHLTVRNCILHDSYDNDIVKINDRARHVAFVGNVFYNQPKGGDEHMDINTVTDVTVEGNLFFNDYAGSGRPNANRTHPYVLIKNSGRERVSERFRVRRNIFLNWEGAPDQPYLLIGEDGKPFHEATDVLVENNLFLCNTGNRIQSAFGVKGAAQVTFRANTVVGDSPHGSWGYAIRINREGRNVPNDRIFLHNNIWSSPGRAMTYFASGPPADAQNVVLRRNLYWNGGAPVRKRESILNLADDPAALLADPRLPAPTDVILPRWDRDRGTFRSGAKTIEEEFRRLVLTCGALPAGSPAIDAADPANMPEDDILGRLRTGKPDLGAFERGAGK